MTCSHCCGAESIFDRKEADKNLKRYRLKGPNRTTRKLLDALMNEDVTNLTLLDIGGGIGVIQQELLKRGLAKTTDVDASNAYITVAKDLMIKNGFDNKMTFIHGDFNDCHAAVQKHDIVTLEKVVCCYPDVNALITNSTDKATKYYALVYPMDSFFARVINKLGHLYFWLKKNPFRTFIHSEKQMDVLIRSKGFEKVYYGKVFPWRVVVYRCINKEPHGSLSID